MYQPVMPFGPAGFARFFCIAIGLLLSAPPALAATLQWQALSDRERVIINIDQGGGVAGQVSRIAPTGVIIPFTDVPAGLHVDEQPEGAAIFQGTRQYGRALVLMTKTPEFGYVVSRQTLSEIVIDFFHNPLGVRWKPTATAPTTEIAPENPPGHISDPNALTTALETDPLGKSPESAAMVTALEARYAEMQSVLQGDNPPASPAARQATPTQAAPTQAAPTQAAPTQAAPAQAAPAQAAPAQAAPAQAAPAQAAPAQAAPAQAAPAQAAPAQAAPAQATPTQATQTQAAPARSVPTPPAAPNTPGKSEEASSLTPPVARPAPTLYGSPTHVLQSTKNLEPEPPKAPQQDPPRPEARTDSGNVVFTPPVDAPALPATENKIVQGVFRAPIVDNRAQTSARSATLPQPQPPLASAGPVGATASIATKDTEPAAAVTRQTATAPAAIATDQAAATSTATAPAATEPAAAVTRQTATAPAATEPAATGQAATSVVPVPPGVGVRTSSGIYGGSIHLGDKDDLPPDNATFTHPHAMEEPKAQIIYTDAEGNPVDAPPDPAVLIPEIGEHVRSGQFQNALEKAADLLDRGALTADQREEMLHLKAEMLFAVNKDALSEHYVEISDASNQAIHFNQQSRRNAAALLRMGYMNLKLNNMPEAEARFNMLRKLFPDDENVPLTYYYWGDYYFGRGELQRAADEFQYVLQKYPNSRYVRESSLGLARSFYQLEYYAQSYDIVDYIERRWDRFYIQYPPFLNMMGDVAYRLNKLDVALKYYWLYLNLEPQGTEADIILTRIGDIYAQQREKAAAREIYTESAHRFPDKDGGLVATMRLAEEGINDTPTIAGMFSLFDGPYNPAPVETYKTIIDKYPQSALVPLAKLKLALWHLWNKDYAKALDMLSELEQKYPKHELVPRAKEIALQIFAVAAAENRRDQRYTRMREMWEKYPIVRGQEETLTSESRITLGVGYWQDGNPNEALKTVEPFFLGNKIPEYSEMALSLVLSIYLEYDQWAAIREVARRVETWELSEQNQLQLDYGLALAAENLGESDAAGVIWQKLYDSGKLPQAQMAYASFFLARGAERARELEKAYNLGNEALSRLITQVERSPNAADIGKIQTQLASLMDVAETAGRLRESLGFAERYLQYIPENNTERQAVRYRMARIYKKQGDTDTWRKTLGEIMADSPDSVYGRLSASELNAADIARDALQYSPTGQL